MSTPFIGEIRMFAGNFEPSGWAICDGRLLAIAENDALFTLIGTTYGGDGQSTFALPDLRSRVPVHMGTLTGGGTYTIGQFGGVETLTLTVNQTPAHSHPAQCSAVAATSPSPAGGVWAAGDLAAFTAGANANATMNAGAVSAVGGSQPHDNMVPFLAINFIISLFGIFPTQN
jgi:microcystin-dependent protein